jgi:tellurite resistance protein
LARYGAVDSIPDDVAEWDVRGVRSPARLAAALHDARQMARLFVRLATVVTDIDVGVVDDWEWHGATERFEEVAERIGAPNLSKRAAGISLS